MQHQPTTHPSVYAKPGTYPNMPRYRRTRPLGPLYRAPELWARRFEPVVKVQRDSSGKPTYPVETILPGCGVYLVDDPDLPSGFSHLNPYVQRRLRARAKKAGMYLFIRKSQFFQGLYIANDAPSGDWDARPWALAGEDVAFAWVYPSPRGGYEYDYEMVKYRAPESLGFLGHAPILFPDSSDYPLVEFYRDLPRGKGFYVHSFSRRLVPDFRAYARLRGWDVVVKKVQAVNRDGEPEFRNTPYMTDLFFYGRL